MSLNGPLKSPVLSTSGQAIADATTDALSTIAVYPLALVITRLQIQRKEHQNQGVSRKTNDSGAGSSDERAKSALTTARDEILVVVREVYENEGGLKGLYAGCAEAAGKAAADSLLRFLVHTSVNRHLAKGNGANTGRPLSLINQVAIGLLAELVAITLTAPFGTVITRKQARGLTQKPPLTSSQILTAILSNDGRKGLWAGCAASLFLTLNLPLTLLLNEALKYTLFSRSKSIHKSAAIQYVLWGFCHATASSVTYPLSVLQTRSRAGDEMRTSGLSTDLRDISQSIRTGGPDPLYAGLVAEMVRIFTKDGASTLLSRLTHASLYQTYCFFSSLFERSKRLDEILSRHSQLSAHAAASDASTGKLQGWGYTNETAELVGDYVEDQAEDWRSFYHWFWDPERRRNGN
jgi:uncharacterized protein YneF (UPF0154 family)